ncbi:fluoride efflux transporter CrcB [Levilactobacillus lanxiensis]|uniref:Fluoride-specific ion channel FluC n=1 Tax=Levilactobacillus lanxiensis TaxID=2799568 RepID=A0ABW4D351_9LACO|nr:fluoride efflux transporter CrcB [Levilactobacillus lanxiensis]
MAAVAGLGATVGALGRYGMTRLVQSYHGNRWPLATLLINWLGCLLLGFLTGWQATNLTAILLGTGVLGGFTTYSTFSHEVVMLADQRRYGAMTLYLLLSVVGGLILAAGGSWLGWLFR